MKNNQFANTYRNVIAKIKKILKTEIKSPIDMTDVFLFSGIGFITYGVMEIHRAAGFITCGVLLFFIGLVGVFSLGRKPNRKSKGN
jgi:hypothetical protein